MYNNDVMIVKECRKFNLYKLVKMPDTDYSSDGAVKGQLQWQKYHVIDVSGFISFGVGQLHFLIATEKFIYQYKFDPEDKKDYIPRHISTMFNFLQCTNMLFGDAGKRCIIYQRNQPDVTVYFRKYTHNFQETIDT